ncbi:DEAD/DEAH box helicase [Thermococcus chitonophagus]|uniref:ATP-dependent RNA helicase, putative n=1 Tax=Thermococcus chitonophagus TaxID=54262 RepID=A0A160VQN7_9EURY|nr:DEAD/DEAH box helicase [Thermococcus chitonophagus]ASJ15611.1 DEAD/DEAH box helicase [Thermococcus chitonophagus]CUX76819.1 ATP-dependent RNA helicase, putative [Thermococcus chitonophagus]
MYLKKELLQPRLYQEVIYAKCKERNCLIVLPTGLGKTIIAMMIADYRLSKYGGKVLMLAPTKPLVLQHAETFRKFFNLPHDKIVALTGEISPSERQRAWARAKVIVATPQTIENDLLVGRISLEDVVLLVFDEAHRAVGNYAYVYIAKEYREQARNPLVIGLTASPGSTPEKIMEVLNNLGIEHVEYRSESSPDVKPYVQGIKFEWIRVDLPELYKEVRKLLREMLKDALKPLAEAALIDSSSPDIPKKEILRAGQIINEEMAKGNHDLRKYLLFHAMALKLHHAIELLETQGLSALRAYLKKLYEEARSGSTKASKELFSDKRMKKAISLLVQARELGLDHPKIDKLKELINEQIEKKLNSKIIVFTNYRETAKKLVEELSREGLKVKRFVGQASKENDRGMSQREQKLVLDAFARGEFNVLVATSVGEEGLDVPEVDLVVFYEPVPSAIRSIQRRGRTGRHRPGRVVILMAKGTRDEAYYWSSRQKEKVMQETIKKVSQMIKRQKQTSLETFVQRSEKKGLEAWLSRGETRGEKVKEERRGIKVVVDSRELRSEVVKRLKTLGVKLEFKTLDVGDYIVSEDVAIERKSANDFIQSIIDGRLFDQVKRLKEAYPRPIVIVEGQLYGIRNVHPNAIRGAIAAVTVDFGVPVIFSSNPEETAQYIFLIAKREQEEKEKEVRIRSEKKALTLAERQRLIVEGLPHVSATLAKRLLRHFGTVERVFTASEAELMKVDGIGEKIAREIRKVITAPYREEG